MTFSIRTHEFHVTLHYTWTASWTKLFTDDITLALDIKSALKTTVLKLGRPSSINMQETLKYL